MRAGWLAREPGRSCSRLRNLYEEHVSSKHPGRARKWSR